MFRKKNLYTFSTFRIKIFIAHLKKKLLHVSKKQICTACSARLEKKYIHGRFSTIRKKLFTARLEKNYLLHV